MSVDAAQFRDALARWASGVTIVTATGARGPVGITASAFSSLSLEPPLVLVCVGRESGSHDDLVGAERFAVHVLEEGQEELSSRFARAGGEKFVGVDWSDGSSGVPLLPGALAQIVCTRERSFDGGDHTILVGHVVSVEVSDGRPLLYWAGGYRSLRPSVTAP